jgi:pimeloyl-ACP methyl ester carboxylesterase
MKKKILFVIRLVLLTFFSLLWFILIQAEYEMITKPVLQQDFPVIKGVGAVYFLGIVLLIISAIIFYLGKRFIKGILISIGITIALVPFAFILFLFKPPQVSVEGVPQGFTEKQVVVGDITMNYVEGPNNGLPLLLIPGQMESWQGYKLVFPELSKKFHIFVPDLRGHGKSTRTPGYYSYNIVGNDLKLFIAEEIKEPAIVAGLSSGGVLAIWLGAYAPHDVLAVIAEDPPIFSSIWPRIQNEKFMTRNFKLAVDILGKPGKRDVEAYMSSMGAPAQGKRELLLIPSFIIKTMFFLARFNLAVHLNSPFDVPFLPYNLRAGYKFLSEYDTDFSRATIDGDLSRDFAPEDALKQVACPMLLLRAQAYRHDYWGIIGAIDDDDLKRVSSLVPNLTVVQIGSTHEIHLVQPRRYIDEVTTFVNNLKKEHKLP